MKVFLTGLLLYAFPIVFSYVFTKSLIVSTEHIVQKVSEGDLGDMSMFTYQFTGIGAWLARELGLDDALSLVISAAVTKFSLRMIPFLRV
jgi:HD-like signal output (HDOD) protein